MSTLRPRLPRAAPYRRQPWSTWAFTFLLAVVVAGLWRAGVHALPAVTHDRGVSWPFLAAAFAAGNVGVISFEFLGENQEITLSEVPLLLGLFLAVPERLLLATAAGSVVAVLCSRDPPIKAAFNVVVRSLETVVAVVCFRAALSAFATEAVSPGRAISSPGILAALLAVAAANLASTLCVQAVIALSVRRFNPAGLRALLVVLLGVAIINVAVGIVAVDLLLASWLALGLFLGVTLALGFSYRAHSRLRRRHHDLEDMYRFSRTLAGLTEGKDVIRAVLTEAGVRLRCRRAELALNGADGTACYTLREDGALTCRIERGPHPLQAAAEATGGIMAGGPHGEKRFREELSLCGFSDAVAAALPPINSIGGLLVAADRIGDQTRFERSDLDLLAVLAGQTATALHAAQLLDWLREEVTTQNHLALHDPLTDLANRTLFNQRIETMLEQRRDAEVVVVMIMDLDRFKLINDTFGHQGGDTILRQIADQLTHAVGAEGSVGRLGGDEFGVVAGVATRSDVAAFTVDVLTAGRATISAGGVSLDVEASVGVAVAPDHGDDRSGLLHAADVAMYHAKANRSGIAVYRPDHERRDARTALGGA